MPLKTKTRETQLPSSFQPMYTNDMPASLLALAGGLIAHCGGIERTMMAALAYARDTKQMTMPKLYNSAKERNSAWLRVVEIIRAGDSRVLAKARQMSKQTASLFELRNALAHSIWRGLDVAGTLWLEQAQEKKGKYFFKTIPIPQTLLAKYVINADRLYRDHIQFLIVEILRLPPENARAALKKLSWPPHDEVRGERFGLP